MYPTNQNIMPKKVNAVKLKSIPVYLPEEKREALNVISIAKRTPLTRLIEAEIDKLLAREAKEGAK